MLTSKTSASPAAEGRPAIRTRGTMARGLSLLALALLLAGLALLAAHLLLPAPLPYEPVDPAVLQAALEAKTERWLYLTELQERIDAWEQAQKK